MTTKNNETTSGQLWESLAVIGLLGLAFAWLADWLPSHDTTAVSSTVYTFAKWAVVSVALVATLAVISLAGWYGPLLLKRRKLSLTRADIDVELIKSELADRQADIAEG